MIMNWKKGIISLCTAAVFLLIPQYMACAEEAETYIHQENYSADYELKGLFASCEEYFQTEDWDIRDASLKLRYTATTIVREEVSDFTVSLNGQPIYSQKIPLTAGETQELTIKLPQDLIKKGPNSIRVDSYIRTNDTDPCEDDISTASWMVITRESYVSVSYIPLTLCRNVADVYKQITGIEGLENKLSSVFIPENASANELTSAALLLSGVAGNASLFYDDLPLNSASSFEMLSDKKYSVYISEYSRLLPKVAELLSGEQKEEAEKGAVLVFLKLSEGSNMLVVTGSGEAALQNACRLFGNKEYMEQTQAVWRKVSADEDVTVMPVFSETTMLTQTGSYVKGPFRQTASFPVAMGANNTIAAGSEVEIDFRYAQNLDFNRSLVTVFIGDVPVGSKKLSQENAQGDSLKVSIPNNLQITGDFTLSVAFDLEVPGLICDVRQQDMPWAYVTNRSGIHLITGELPYLLFDYYPHPFVKEGNWNQVTVVLPVKESAADMDVMRRFVLTMGRYLSGNAGSIRVCRADNMGELTKANIVSIGSLEANPIVQQINNQLYFKFSPGGTTIRSNEKMKIEPNYGASLGTAQIVYSPYSADKYALLVISGVTEEGMQNAAQYLGNVEKNWEIYGDAFVADEELVYSYRFGKDNSKQQSILIKAAQQKDLVVLVSVGGSIFLLMLISLLLIWRKHRNI